VIETQQQHHWNHSESQLIQDLDLNMWLSSIMRPFIELYFVLKQIIITLNINKYCIKTSRFVFNLLSNIESTFVFNTFSILKMF
jgi:hypothetical protein